MRKLPPLNAVRAFEAAARHVSFTKAAKELFVTHGAVSKQVAILEAWLGAPLFSRTQSQLKLTDQGRTFLSTVTPALDRIAVTAMQLVEQAEPTALRINAPPTFTMRWLIPRILAFQKRPGGVEVKLTTSTAPVNFDEFGYDVAIRGSDTALPGMVSVPFMSEIIVPICHPDLLEGASLLKPKDLAKHTLISYDTEPLSWDDWFGLAKLDSPIKPVKHLRFEQMYFALQAAIEGLGVVLVPLFLVADEVIMGRLCAPFGLRIARQRRYFAHSPQLTAHNPIIESFSSWLVKEGQDTEQSIEQLAKTMNW
jgi:LysR family glycine cleavage system transcriptional activator